jgi:hypothetical protein
MSTSFDVQKRLENMHHVCGYEGSMSGAAGPGMQSSSQFSESSPNLVAMLQQAQAQAQAQAQVHADYLQPILQPFTSMPCGLIMSCRRVSFALRCLEAVGFQVGCSQSSNSAAPGTGRAIINCGEAIMFVGAGM